MRGRFILYMLIILIMLTGCDNSLSYSENDENMISEYIANKLLKYNDESYDGWYFVNDDTNDINENDDEFSELEVEDNSENSFDPTEKDPVINDEQDLKNKDLLSLDTFKINKNLIIKYKGCKSYDIYPEKDETYFSLKPRDDHKLLVLDFTIKNESSKKIKLNLTKTNYKYKLFINGEMKLKPLLTLLENDLQYLNMDISANKSAEVILIFEVKSNIEADDMILEVKNEKDEILYMLEK
ncbi:MAG TPA: hypothetical protein GX695_04645 [Acholeplasmataceae bacterium]|nr:hypothetical protein [Acholeplasmataceae bacterium]